MSNQGWIMLHRQLQDCWIWNKEPFSMGQAWIDLLLSANHKEKKIFINGGIKEIKRGQFHTSILKLADRWQWSRGKVKRFLDVLEHDQMITVECSIGGTTNGTTITIVNYGIYQDYGATNDTTVESTVDTTVGQRSVQRSDINNNDKKENNVKNVKNEKNNKLPFGEFQNVKLTQEEYDRLANDYGTEQRKAAIKYLDEYIEEKGYKSKSHNLSIRRWVMNAITEHGPEPKKQGQSDFMIRLQEAIERKEAENVNT